MASRLCARISTDRDAYVGYQMDGVPLWLKVTEVSFAPGWRPDAVLSVEDEADQVCSLVNHVRAVPYMIHTNHLQFTVTCHERMPGGEFIANLGKAADMIMDMMEAA